MLNIFKSDPTAERRKANAKKKKNNDDDDEDDQKGVDPGILYGEDDEFYRKWAGPVLLGPMIPAILSLLIIVAGELLLNSNDIGTCGYPLTGKSL